MTRPPILQRPVYLAGAEPSERVQEACRKAAPVAGAIGTAILGAAAGYFAPKLFDWLGRTWRDRDDDSDVVEIDT